jgi:hypothetical protein
MARDEKEPKMPDVLRFVLMGIAILVFLALIWFAAGRPESGPGGEASRRARERGGGWPLG